MGPWSNNGYSDQKSPRGDHIAIMQSTVIARSSWRVSSTMRRGKQPYSAATALSKGGITAVRSGDVKLTRDLCFAIAIEKANYRNSSICASPAENFRECPKDLFLRKSVRAQALDLMMFAIPRFPSRLSPDDFSPILRSSRYGRRRLT